MKLTDGETLALVSVPTHCTFRRGDVNLVQKLRFIAALVQRGSLEATKAVGRLEMPGWL